MSSEVDASCAEETADRLAKVQDSIDLLVACGYFRARIKGLCTFDKIIGGIVWCISVCNQSIDVDLLFSENSSIGQRIALTEHIVRVLQLLKCPFAIQPHQLQGLDIHNIYPVIQWLVNKTVTVKEKHGDEMESFAEYMQIQMTKQKPPEDHRLENLSKTSCRDHTFKRGPNTHPNTLRDDVICTLAEYSMHSKQSTSPENDPKLEISSQKDKLRMVSEEKVANSSALMCSENWDQQDGYVEDTRYQLQLLKADAESKQLDDQLEKEKLQLEELRQKLEETTTSIDNFNQKIALVAPEDIEKYSNLLEQYENVSQNEKKFKVDCRSRMEELQKEHENFYELLENGEKDGETSALDLRLTNLEEQLATARLDNAEISRVVAELQNSIDVVPSQLEVAQYHQRFLELYNQMGTKHRQTRQCYTLYNTLLDVHNYMKKEIDLLAKIEDVLPMATKDGYRESFVQNLQQILKSVEEAHEKISSTNKHTQQQKADLTIEMAQLKDNGRKMVKAVDKLKKALLRNEHLREGIRNTELAT